MSKLKNGILQFEKGIAATEKMFTAILLCIISFLVFLSAIMRKIGMPINWAQDFSLLCFAWLTFIGGDVLMRTSKLISIDMITKLLPKTVQKVIAIIFDFGMIAFLLILVWFGFPLVNESWSRVFNTLNLSYAWCTLCVPVGSILMLETTIHNTVKDIVRKPSEWGVEK